MIRYYLNQQLLTFCIAPKFREQSSQQQQIAHRHQRRTSPVHLNEKVSSHKARELSSLNSLTFDGLQHSAELHTHSFQSYRLPVSNYYRYHNQTFLLKNAPPDKGNYTPNFYILNGDSHILSYA